VIAPMVERLRTSAETELTFAARGWGVIGPTADDAAAETVLNEIHANSIGHARWLVLGWIGTHPDAHAPVLRRSWRIEEACRAGGIPTLTLRLAPLVGPKSPFWLELVGGAGRLAGRPIQPVLERDVVTLLQRILAGDGPRAGWYEVCGPDIVTLGELADIARSAQPSGAELGFWEPDFSVLREQPLVEPEIWVNAFGIEAASVLRGMGERVA